MNNTDNLFAQDASEGAAWGLLALMAGLSEEHYCALWLDGLEWSAWSWRENGPQRFGMGEITQRQRDLIRLLSEECDGWWAWTGAHANSGPEFVRLQDWRARVAEREGSQS